MTLIEGEEFDALEATVDQWRDSIAIPDWSLRRAQWTLLSVTEDMFRLGVERIRRRVSDVGQYLQLIDDYKYMLKYALARVQRLPDVRFSSRPDLNNNEYGRALDVLQAHEMFNTAVASFSGARAGAVECRRDPSGAFVFTNTLPFERQANDILESRTATPEVTPLVLLCGFLFRPDEDLPPELARCVRRIRSTVGDVRPRLTEGLLDEIDGILGNRRRVLPAQWACSLGSGHELSRAFRNLGVASIAHLVAVSNGAISTTNTQPGLHVRWLLGEEKPSGLADKLSRKGGVSPSQARELVKLLTYGLGTTHPDPALQFVFALRGGALAIPWFLIATSNLERNFLTLLARLRPSEFDAASDSFEQEMLADVRNAISSRAWASRFSKYVPDESAAGEVDAILVDSQSAFVLVIEMRWFLEPSEVNEVRTRERNGEEKARQARRKRDAVRRALTGTLHAMGIATAGRDWRVESVAVFDNYLPTPAGDVPFVSHRAFVSGIYRERTLVGLWDWIKSDAWLPKRSVHFTTQRVAATLGDVEIELDGLDPTQAGEDFVMARDAQLLRAWGLRPP